MPKLVPLARTPVVAIEAKHDIICEKGQWIIIHADETVEVMSKSLVNAIYRVDNGANRAKPPAVIRVRHVSTNGSLVYQAEDGKRIRVGAQIVRFLSYLNQFPDGETVATIAGVAHENDRKTVLKSLSALPALGFADKEGDKYKINNNGRAIVTQLGTAANSYV